MRSWSYLTIGIVLCIFALFKIIPPFLRPGSFTEFGAGYMVGNGLVLTVGLLIVYLAWRGRKKN